MSRIPNNQLTVGALKAYAYRINASVAFGFGALQGMAACREFRAADTSNAISTEHFVFSQRATMGKRARTTSPAAWMREDQAGGDFYPASSTGQADQHGPKDHNDLRPGLVHNQ